MVDTGKEKRFPSDQKTFCGPASGDAEGRRELTTGKKVSPHSRATKASPREPLHFTSLHKMEAYNFKSFSTTMEESAYFLDSAACASKEAQQPNTAADCPPVADPYFSDEIKFDEPIYASYLGELPETRALQKMTPRGGDLYASDDDETVDNQAEGDIMSPYQLDKESGSQIEEDEREPKSENGKINSSLRPAEALSQSSATHTDFNLQFQQIMELEDSETKYEKMSQLANDFAYVAESYGKIIIAEKSLPTERKTIKPINVGGVAGGDKFIVSGILFKFAAGDSSINIYGNEENAQKIASHELLGLNSFFLSGVPGLSYPLMALVHYLGFCVVAISVIPIDKDTLKYGSSDAGATMHFDDPLLYNKVKEACQKLNLKPHKAGLDPKPDDPDQYGPGDIEGHEGTDGRFYMLDFARLMPPECPLPGQLREKGSLFFQLLRPELVKSNAVPLSSDALTGWGMKDPNKGIHNREVLDATLRLRSNVIPGLVSQLTKEYQAALETAYRKHAINVYSENLSARLHAAGVNLRHLGLVRKATTNEPLRALLLCEMIARVFKCKLNGKLRRAVTSDVGVAFDKCRKIVADVLCLLLRAGEDESKIKNWWSDKIKYILEVKFPGGLTEKELTDDFDLWNSFDVSQDASHLHKEAMFSRFIYMSKVQLTENAQKHAAASWSSKSAVGPTLILPSDVLYLLPKTKNSVIGDLYFSFSKYLHAVRVIKRNPAVATRLLELVLAALKKAPQMSSIFYEKLLISSIGPIMSDMHPSSSNEVAQILSNILDTSLTASLIQRYGLGQEDFSKAIAKEYVHAARIMRKSGSLDSARWMISRAANFGAESVDLMLEKWKLGERPESRGIQQYLDNPDVCWMALRSLFSMFSSFRLAQPMLEGYEENFPLFLRCLSVVVKDAPHYFARKRFGTAVANEAFIPILLYCCQPSVWNSFQVDASSLDNVVDLVHRNVAHLPRVALTRAAMNDLAPKLFSPRHEKVQWSTRELLFMYTTISSSNLALMVRACAANLQVLVLHLVQEPIDSLDFLKQLPFLRKLGLTQVKFTDPAVVGQLPSLVLSQLDALHLDGIELFDSQHILRCLSHFTRLTKVGLPLVSAPPKQNPDAPLTEQIQAMQNQLIEIYMPYFVNLTHLRFRGAHIPPNFVQMLHSALDSAANLKLVDFTDSLGTLDLHNVVSLAHPNLLVVISQAGEPIWFSGPTSRVAHAHKGLVATAPQWHCELKPDQNADLKDALDPYVEEILAGALVHRNTVDKTTSVIPVCVVSLFSSSNRRFVDFGRALVKFTATSEIQCQKTQQDASVGYTHNYLCTLKQLSNTIILTVGKNSVHMNAQITLSKSEVPLWAGNKAVREYNQWDKLKIHIQPRTCITALCVGFLLALSSMR